ncbi:MAG: tRNA (adenosine(37)-N6)-dimethylallyltransferase MiaA [Candidatus Paceibacterota bacterium]
MNARSKIIVIVGPTASGKTGLAIELAKRFDGEVISADSRQVYRGLDIGTAKVTEEEMDGVPHHLLDIADVEDVYTAADFKRDAERAIADIAERDKLPIIAGGTFFYIDALLGTAQLPEVEPDPELRTELETKSPEALFAALRTLDPERAAAIDPHNKRRLVRALEVVRTLGTVPVLKQLSDHYDVLMIGIGVDMETHGDVTKKRLLARFDQGLVGEVEGLLARGVPHERLEGLGLEYRYVSRYLRNEVSYDEMVDELAIKIRQYAKRQLSWLKRYTNLHLVGRSDIDAAVSAVQQFVTEE